MNIDGSDQRQLTKSEGGHSNFVTADGRVVYYTADISRALRRNDVETGVESDMPLIVGLAPTFSPDGKLVASFDRAPDDRGEVKIRIQDLDEKAPIRTVAVGDSTLQPVDLEWSGDGRTLSYVVRRSGEYELGNLDLRLELHLLVSRLRPEPLHRVTLSPY
jgi:Tol biopolymer transport system component